MSKHISLFVLLSIFSISLFGQKYGTKEGKIVFDATAALEKIEGTTSKASSVFDASTGNIEWKVLVKGFHFDKALMEEHFNENYMESTKFPKASFKGQISNMSAINLTKDGTYKAKISGNLEIHGVSQKINTEATMTVSGGKVTAKSNFIVSLADYKIEIPALVKDTVSKTAKISVEAVYTVVKS